MDMRRTAPEAHKDSRQAPGHRDAASFARSLIEGGATMRDVMVAGGLRRFTPAEMFPERNR